MLTRNELKLLAYACDLYAMHKNKDEWYASIMFIMKAYV